jgi:hypothetical protein
MAEVLVCAKCQSEKIIPSARVMDRGDYSADAGNLTLVVDENPEALVFKGSHKSELYARVCGDCGFSELYVEDPQELYQVYAEFQPQDEEDD